MDTERDSSLFRSFFYWLCLVKFREKVDTKFKLCRHYLFVFACVVVLLIIYVLSWLYKQKIRRVQIMLIILELTQIYGLLVVHLSLLADNILRSRLDIEIWEIIKKIDRAMNRLYIEQCNRQFIQRYLIIFLIIVTFPTIPTIMIIASSFYSYRGWSIGWSMRLWSLLSMFAQLAHYAFYIAYLADIYERVHTELIRISNLSTEVFSDRIIREHLLAAERAHYAISQLFMKFDARFKLFLIIMLLNSFICSTSTVYWIGALLYRKKYIYIFEALLAFSPHSVPVIVLIDACESLHRKMNFIAPILHRLSLVYSDEKTVQIIRRFSIRVWSSRKYFALSSIGLLDYSAVTKLIYGLSTYFVIIFMTNEIN